MSDFVRKIVNYVSGATFNRILLVLLLPLFTRKMLPDQFALYGNISIFISFFTLIYFLGLPQALYPFYHKESTSHTRRTLVTTTYFTLLIVGLIFSIVIFLSKNWISNLILKDTQFADLFLYIVLILFFDVFYGVTLTLLNIMEQSFYYAVLGAVKNFVFVLLIGTGYLIDKFTIQDIVHYMMLSSLIAAVIAIIYLNFKVLPLFEKTDNRMFSLPLLKEILKFSLPMIPGTIAFLALRISDRYMLTWLSPNGLYDVGIYTVGYRVGMTMSFATSLLSIIYYPYAMRISNEEFASRNYLKVHKYYLIIGGIFAFILMLFLKELFWIFIGPSYIESLKIVVFGVTSVFLLGAFHIVNIPFYNARKSTHIALVAIFGAIINIGLNYLFIPKFGIWAAGVSSVFSYFLIYMFTLIGANRISDIKFPIYPMIMFLAGIFLINILNLYSYGFQWLFLKVLFIILIVIILCLTKVFDKFKKQLNRLRR